jgi:hypothetical protein
MKPIWKGTLETGSEADVDRAIDRLKSLRVDFVKITDNTLEPELFLYAVRQARAAGLRASGHIPLAITVRQAVDAGLSSIEHLDYAYSAGVRDEAAIAADFGAGRIKREQAVARQDAGFDRPTAMDTYRYLAHKGVFVTPALACARPTSGAFSARPRRARIRSRKGTRAMSGLPTSFRCFSRRASRSWPAPTRDT